jgi:hypothetical protein
MFDCPVALMLDWIKRREFAPSDSLEFDVRTNLAAGTAKPGMNVEVCGSTRTNAMNYWTKPSNILTMTGETKVISE